MSQQQQQPRGRGRGQGRARGQQPSGGPRQPADRADQRPGPPQQHTQQQYRPQQQQQYRPQQQHSQARGRPHQAERAPQQSVPAPSAWGPPAAAAAAAGGGDASGGAVPRPPLSGPPQAQAQAGRGTARAAEGATASGQVSGATGGQGDGNGNGGRSGNVRGRVATRPRIDPNFHCTPLTKGSNKKGASGNPVNLVANYVRLRKPRDEKADKSLGWHLWQYQVDFAPEVDDTRKRKYLVRTAVRTVFTTGYLYDGTNIYSPQLLHEESNEFFVQDGDQDSQNIRVTIRRVGEKTYGDYTYLQVFNIIMRKCLTLMEMTLVGRNYFNPSAAVIHEQDFVELWPGYFTSIRQHEYDILLNVDLQFKFMNTEHVFKVICDHRGPRSNLQQEMSGRVVLTRYNNKTYKIDDIDFSKNPLHKFKKRDGSEISYKEYFEGRYKVRITNTSQPMLVSKCSAREVRAGMPNIVYLVPELCYLTGLSTKQRENFHLMRRLAETTRIGPKGRIEKLNAFIDKINKKQDIVQELTKWDVGFDRALIQFKGRVLPREYLHHGGGRPEDRYASNAEADWSRDVRSQPMFHRAELPRLLLVTPHNFKKQTEDFVGMVKKCAAGMQWRLGNTKTYAVPSDRTSDYLSVIDEAISNESPTFLIITLPNPNSDRYSSIKKKCYVDRGMPCQMIVARNLSSKGAMSIATKVAIQINCKLGGAPWTVAVPLSSLMVVGYDVCRDTSNRSMSFGGYVASIDRNLTRYYSSVFEHTNQEELSNNFGAFMLLACKEYYKVNQKYPEKILIFRDGVGEGDLPYVKEIEINEIKRKLTEKIYTTNNLRMCFIVVSKRINTRIFWENQNPQPGTVADDVITQPERYDFYLVSQCVRQGTVSPTSYNILDDNMGLDADKLQKLSYKLTHMYYNWSGTVRVPAPCQYAHKLAFITSQHLHRAAAANLSDTLYYL